MNFVCKMCGESFDRGMSAIRKGEIHCCSTECRLVRLSLLNEKKLEDSFWEKVFIITYDRGCWIWTGGTDEDGYGVIKRNGHGIKCHRISWQIHFGEIPDGMKVLHRCDNPPCVRPEHLFLGTDLDNRRDCVQKLRHNFGEKGGRSKLREQQVIQIRSEYSPRKVSLSMLASKYGVHRKKILAILQRKTWTHI